MMNKFVKIVAWLMVVPVVVSLAGCPAMGIARIAKKASESSSSSDKDTAAKSSTTATTTPYP